MTCSINRSRRPKPPTGKRGPARLPNSHGGPGMKALPRKSSHVCPKIPDWAGVTLVFPTELVLVSSPGRNQQVYSPGIYRLMVPYRWRP